MSSRDQKQANTLPFVAMVCLVGLIGAVIWSSGRALELTDEAYYLLSAIHPEQVTLYISAQHWVLAPLWNMTETIQGFRLTGAVLLVATASVLALGSMRVLSLHTDICPSNTMVTGAVGAAGVGALLYVATIAPSPSYNLLASAGAYGALGFALLAVERSRILSAFLFCFAAGFCLAVCFINKPSSGICSALVVLALTLGLQSGWRSLGLMAAGLAGVASTLFGFILLQPGSLPVQDSFIAGLELFRLVQTEPVGVRLLRYASTLLTSVGASVFAFWPAYVGVAVLFWRPSRWVSIAILGLLLVMTLLGKHHLGGMMRYTQIAQGIYALIILSLLVGFRQWTANFRIGLLFAGLIALPFAVAMGTGNALFTQVIVTLAPWTLAAMLIGNLGHPDAHRRLLLKGIAGGLICLVTLQILSSFTRDPYHLAAPLTEQTSIVDLGDLGTLRVDATTAAMLDDIRAAKNTCEIEPGATFFGLLNVPGLSLVFDAIPPVSPWLNNPAQAEVILKYWTQQRGERVVIVLSQEVSGDPQVLPASLQPRKNGFDFCGRSAMPYDGKPFEIWASSDRYR